MSENHQVKAIFLKIEFEKASSGSIALLGKKIRGDQYSDLPLLLIYATNA